MAACRPPIPLLGCLFSFFLLHWARDWLALALNTGTQQKNKIRPGWHFFLTTGNYVVVLYQDSRSHVSETASGVRLGSDGRQGARAAVHTAGSPRSPSRGKLCGPWHRTPRCPSRAGPTPPTTQCRDCSTRAARCVVRAAHPADPGTGQGGTPSIRAVSDSCPSECRKSCAPNSAGHTDASPPRMRMLRADRCSHRHLPTSICAHASDPSQGARSQTRSYRGLGCLVIGAVFLRAPRRYGAGRWLGLSLGELAPQPAAERRCEIEAARPLRAACPAGARMVP